MNKLKPLPITYIAGTDLEEYRRKWRGEDAIDNLMNLLFKLGIIRMYKED